MMAAHLDKTLQRREDSDNRTALVEEEEQILKCLGAALIMHWNAVPTKLRLRQRHRRPAASDAAEGTDRAFPSQS